MLRQPRNARRYTQPVELRYSAPQADGYGHVSLGEPVTVLRAFASVTRMSESKTMMTFQQADAVGVEIEMRWTPVLFNSIRWQGHDIVFSAPDNAGQRDRVMRITGYYVVRNPR